MKLSKLVAGHTRADVTFSIIGIACLMMLPLFALGQMNWLGDLEPACRHKVLRGLVGGTLMSYSGVGVAALLRLRSIRLSGRS